MGSENVGVATSHDKNGGQVGSRQIGRLGKKRQRMANSDGRLGKRKLIVGVAINHDGRRQPR